MRIVDWNYAFDPATDLAASSEDSEFPVSNMRKHTRGKVWRSSGYFKIGSTNKYIDFDEGGSELNATLAEGTYTPSELATEIKTQLDAAGAATYTVSYSSTTGKWTIASDGATLNLLWNSGTNTANTAGGVIGFDTSADESGAVSYTGAAIAIHTGEWIRFDLRTWGTNPVDSVAILFDPVNGPQLSDEAVIKIQANQTPNFTSPAVDQTVTIDEDYSVITHFFSSSQSYRYWRVYIEDPRNPDLYVEIPKVFLGLADATFTLDPEIGYIDTYEDLSRHQENDYGNRFSDIYPNRREANFSWSQLTEAQKLSLQKIYLRAGGIVPVLVVLDPTEATFSNKDENTFYAYLDNKFKTEHAFYTYSNTTMKLMEAF